MSHVCQSHVFSRPLLVQYLKLKNFNIYFEKEEFKESVEKITHARTHAYPRPAGIQLECTYYAL